MTNINDYIDSDEEEAENARLVFNGGNPRIIVTAGFLTKQGAIDLRDKLNELIIKLPDSDGVIKISL